MDWRNRPIPSKRQTTQGWKEVPIDQMSSYFHQELVSVMMAPPQVVGGTAVYAGQDTSSPYYPSGLKEALLQPFLRQTALSRLKLASTHLPEGHFFWVWDAYRPIAVQGALYSCYYEQNRREHPEMSEEELTRATCRLVSQPSDDSNKPSPHNTGGAIDLTVARMSTSAWAEYCGLHKQRWMNGEATVAQLVELYQREVTMLDMGTPFDSDADQTETAYYEKKLAKGSRLFSEEYDILQNRRVLYWAMARAGFSNYEEEWWHFDLGNQFWAKREGMVAALYGPTVLSAKNLEQENEQRQAWEEAIDRFGEDLRISHFPQAAKL